VLKISLERYMNNPALVPISDVETGTICMSIEDIPVMATGMETDRGFEIIEFGAGAVEVSHVPGYYPVRPMTKPVTLSITLTDDEDE